MLSEFSSIRSKLTTLKSKRQKNVRLKTINIITVLYLIIVSTQYYWESNLGLLAIPSFLILLGVFIILGVVAIIQILKFFLEKLKNRNRMVSALFILFVLLIVYLKPYGVINFEKFEKETILEASRTGGGNCNVKLKLFKNFSFEEKERCFSTSRTRGKWKVENDTIIFTNVKSNWFNGSYYQKAIIRKSNSHNYADELIRFRDNKDTTGQKIWIYKNELNN